MPAPSPSQGRGLLAPALTTPRQGGNPAPSLLTSLDNAKRRQSTAAGCALYALRGCAAAGTGKALAGSPKPFTRRTNKAARSLTRRTTSAASAANGSKVPLPGAHANAPPGGRAGNQYRQAKVGQQSHLRVRQGPIPGAAARCRCRVRTPLSLHAQGIGAVCITTYAAHK